MPSRSNRKKYAVGENGKNMDNQVDEPDSPTSRLMNRIAAIKLNSENTDDMHRGKKFSYIDDIARNPKLAHAARLESASGQGTPTHTSDSAPFLSHDPDIDRQRNVFEALDRDTDLESKLNQEMASVVIGRIQSGRASAEKILSILQAFASAERAYSKALNSIGALELVGDADGATLRDALDDFIRLPQLIGKAHDKASQTSHAPINLVRDLVGTLRNACTELQQGALRVQGDVDASVKSLKQAVEGHKDTCKAFDALILSKGKVMSKPRSIEWDPWIAEGRVVERHAGLRNARASQRKYLAGAFRRVGEIERQRITVTKMALISCVEQLSCSISTQYQEDADAVFASLGAVNGERDLDSFGSMAADSTQGGETLSARQSQMIQYLWRQLEGSSEIVRQGAVKRLEGGSWADGYAVLTRAGFLHWFRANDARIWSFDGGPSKSIHLSKCDFEPGDAPSWRLVECSSRMSGMSWWSNKPSGQTYQTDNIDSCMEWTVVLKEIIASYKPNNTS